MIASGGVDGGASSSLDARGLATSLTRCLHLAAEDALVGLHRGIQKQAAAVAASKEGGPEGRRGHQLVPSVVDRACEQVRSRVMRRGDARAKKFEWLATKFLFSINKIPIGGVLDPGSLIAPLRTLEARRTEASAARDDDESTGEWPVSADYLEEDAVGPSGAATEARVKALEAEFVVASDRMIDEFERARMLAAEADELRELLQLARTCEAEFGAGEPPRNAATIVMALRNLGGHVADLSGEGSASAIAATRGAADSTISMSAKRARQTVLG
eukprot:TRINITY_DN76853_c0_g1_i1.p1 TRINITY_DN76853_c0_g1~~TRINITY_DN76853_c0_g1_i1.p1  ORF type:complete len:273 (-),score=57.81 TRINITY_DN76853_c0_g1_i1:114-932(-)